MKKRLFAMLLALVMIVSVLPLAALAANENDACQYSTNGQHNWNRDTGKCTNNRRVGNSRQYCNAQCTHAAGFGSDNRCNTCDFRCTHKSNNGTSRFKNGVCSSCNYVCQHKNSNGSSAIQNGACSICKMKDNTHEHKYGTDGKCTVSGCTAVCPHAEYDSATGKCKVCQMTCTHPVKNGAAWNNGVCKTCGKACQHDNGYNKSTHKCNTCGKDCQHTDGYNEEYKCNACDKSCSHEYDKTAATGNCKLCGKPCTHTKYQGGKCTTCGMSEHTHTFSSTDGKCTFDGCTAVCSHKFSSETGKCETCEMVCKHSWKLLRYHEGKEPTCTVAGTGAYECEICHKRDGITAPALGHDRVEDVLRAPTCTKHGWQEVTCKREGCSTVITERLEATGHTEVPIEAVPATCTATGLTEGVKCSVCQEILTAQAVAPIIPHTFETPVAEVPVTCLKDGYTAHMKCNFCDATEGKEEIDTDGHEFGEDNLCKKCGVRDGSCLHQNADITTTNPTCMVDGIQIVECSCGYRLEKVLVHPGHDYDENDNCSVCGTAKCSHSRTRTEKEDSTCSKYGYEKTICRDCGKPVTTKTLPLADHDYVNGVCKHCKHIGSKNTTIDFQDIFGVF